MGSAAALRGWAELSSLKQRTEGIGVLAQPLPPARADIPPPIHKRSSHPKAEESPAEWPAWQALAELPLLCYTMGAARRVDELEEALGEAQCFLQKGSAGEAITLKAPDTCQPKVQESVQPFAGVTLVKKKKKALPHR